MQDSRIRACYDRYTEAWNAHDPEAVMAEFAEGGTFADPASGGTLSGGEIGAWVTETTEAFPDVQFEGGRRTGSEEGVLFAEWTMRGTHNGPLQGVPPTGRTVEIDGVDVVTFSEEGITSVTGYFDMAELNEQLGLTFPAVVSQLPKLAVAAVRNAV